MSGVELNVRMTGHERIDFDRKKIRKALRANGRMIQKEARRLVSRRAVSSAGEAPGRDTGALFRSIKTKVSRSGFLAKIAPQKTAEMGDHFYPAYLYYGVRAGSTRTRDHSKKSDGGNGWRIDQRMNFMVEALNNKRNGARVALAESLRDSLVPR